MAGALFIGMVLLVGWFVSAPLRQRESARGEDPELMALRAARDAKLRELRDAELDYATGKLTARDYEPLDAALRAEAAELLRALEQSPGETR